MPPIASIQPVSPPLEPALTEERDFGEVVRLHWPGVYRYALASLGDSDLAQSVAQDCFLKAYRARNSFRGDCSLRTWLMRIALNSVRDAARNRKLMFWKRAAALDLTEVTRCEPDSAASPERAVMLREEVAAVWVAAEKLPRKQKAVFLLRFVEDFELLEIAAITGMKEGTVKTHLCRAVATVRKRLGRKE
jgi:RNA polymerase sigma-70 factor (ECF subfamily)